MESGYGSIQMVISPGFMTVAQKLAEAATAMSHGDIRTRLQDALSDAFRSTSGTSGYYGYSYAYIVDIFGDDKAGDVVYSYNDDLKKAAYTITGTSCTIATDAAVDVAPLTTYEVQSDDAGTLTEAGARNSKRDMAQIQAIHDGSAKLGANCKMAEAARTDSGSLKLTESVTAAEVIPLREALKTGYQIKLIAPGKGSSAFYPKEVLQRDGPRVFKAGLHVYMNHPTAAEEAARPEGDVHNLAGVLAKDAFWLDEHKSGPGLYSELKPFSDHAQAIDEKAPYVGMSIRASGIAESGTKREGVPVLKELTSAESVDVVTRAGAGGLILNESQRSAALPAQEQTSMTPEETTLLRETQASNARLVERALRGDARELAAEALADITLAEAAKRRVIETCIGTVDAPRALPKTAAGELDRPAFLASVVAEAKREGAYVAGLVGSGRVTGMGGGAPSTVELTEAQRTEAVAKRTREDAEAIAVFEGMGMSKAAAEAAAKGRAA